MSLTPEDVQEQKFKERFKGYDIDEVDAFLERVMHAIAELRDERDALRRSLDEGGRTEEPSELLARTLMTAQRAADETVAAAHGEAERLLADARAESTRIEEDARDRVERERAELHAESTRVARAAESLARFRTEYRSRVQAVIAEQLALLDRAGELPDVPAAVQDLATFGASSDELPPPPPASQDALASALGDDDGAGHDGTSDGHHDDVDDPEASALSVSDDWRSGA
jgi:cell division initiation protein